MRVATLAVCIGAVMAGLALLAVLHAWRVRVLTGQLRERMEARLQERERIARDLHDHLLNSVTAVSLLVRAAANQAPEGSPLRERLELALRRASAALSESRDRVRDLQIADSSDRSLVESLSTLAQTLSNELTGVRIHVSSDGDPRILRTAAACEIHGVVRDGLFDALQNGPPDKLEINVRFRARELVLMVRNEVAGAPAAVAVALDDERRRRIAGMHESAQRLGARLVMVPRGGGSELVLHVPAVTAYDRPTRRWWQAGRESLRLPTKGRG